MRVRLIALLLLLGVTAITFDFPGLLREAADRDGALAARDVRIDADALEPDLGLRGHGIEVIDGQTFVVIRLAWIRPPTDDSNVVPPRLRASLSDMDGSSLGWQLLDPSLGTQAGAKQGPTYRLQLPEGVRPARIDLQVAD
jgi:hypothetical protein